MFPGVSFLLLLWSKFWVFWEGTQPAVSFTYIWTYYAGCDIAQTDYLG